MANDWIKMRTNLADDPAVIGIAALTKLDRWSVVGRLHAVWSWADAHSVDGFMPFVTPQIVDEKAGRKGFAAAMAAPGISWLSVEAGGIRFPNFGRHNGESAKVRAEEMERKRLQRERERLEKEAAERDAKAAKADAENAATVTEMSRKTRDASPKVSRETWDKSVTREEKRREYRSSGGGPGSPEAGPARDAKPPGAPGEPPPPRDKIVEPSDFPELQARFPLVDIERERSKALDYVRRERGPSAELELRFFANEWLPKAPARSEARQAQVEAQSDGPDGWREWFQEAFPLAEYPDRKPYHEGPWSKFPTTLRDRFKAEWGKPVAQSA
jgi:hypothetical protein